MPRLALTRAVCPRDPDRPRSAPDRVEVGVLTLTSSAPIVVGVEQGFFREYGIEPEATIALKDIVDTSFLEAAIKAVGN
jgi:ABC-type nitrate/sulfonate/bicarbonate transport system substrate-binding protein